MEVKKAALVVTPHPVSLEGRRVYMPEAAPLQPGETLLEFVGRHDVLPGQQWVVEIDGVQVLEANWARVRPKPGYVIECRRVPNKDVLRIVAFAALSYFTFGAGGAAIFGTGIGGTIAAGAAFLAGSMVLNKMLAPKQPGARAETSTSPTYSLSGGRNRPRPFEPLTLVLGEPYAVPDLASQPYTYFASSEQYLWQMFNLGINCADVSTLRIGQTPLENYVGVTVLRNGLASNNSDLPALGTSVDSIAGAALVGAGPWVQRTSSVDTVVLALDFATSLYRVNDDGVFESMQIDIEVNYRLVGDVTWLPFTPYIPAVPAVTETRYWHISDDSGTTSLPYTYVITEEVREVPAGYIRPTHNSQKPFRFTKQLAVPAGQYEVRVRKETADETGTQASNALEWVQLKSYQQDTGDYDGQARLAINIQASGQLNGSLDELNGQLRAAPMDYWNGTGWVTATDRATGLCNPGAIFLMLARGIRNTKGRLLAGMGYEDDQIDIEGLKQFMVHCDAHGFEFDLNLQTQMSIDDLLEAVAYVGMGAKSWPDGKLGVNFFSADDPIEGVINMGNIKARSFSVTYDTMPTADEIEFAYFDRERGDAWKSLRVVAPGVTMPRSTASTQLTGVTSEAHAATLARFSMAQNIYQRKTVSCEMDLEYMTLRKGGVYALSHDMTQWGYGGRLLACEDNAGEITLTLDDIAPGDDPLGVSTSRYIGLRLPGERQMRVFPVQAFSGDARTVVLDTTWPVGVALPGADPANPARDTMWVYDFKAVPGQRLMVTDISPSANGASITMVPWTDEFWTYVQTGEYFPPPSNSLLRPAPEVVNAGVIEQLARQGNTYYTELTVDFDVTGDYKRAELWGAIGDGLESPPKAMLASGTSQALNWRGGLDERWHLEVRTYGATRAGTPYRMIYDVLGLRAPPPDVTDLVVNGDVVSWTPATVPDLAGYLIRFQYGDNAWWDTAVPLHTGVITESPYTLTRRPQGDVTVLVKAIDTTGNESVNAASYRYGFSEIVVRNPVATFDQHPDFPGEITGGTVSGGDLEADDLDEFYEPATGPMYTPATEPMYGTSQFGELVYEFSVSSTEAGILILQYTIAAENLLVEYQTGGGDAMYEPDADPMYLPADELIYGEFGDWAVWPGSLDFNGDVQVRFRLTLSAGLTQGVIYELTALIDAPEISEVVDDVVIDPAGTRLPLANTYRVIRSVQLTVQSDGGSGVTPRVIDKDPTLGPLVEVLNTSGAAVAGLLDAEIRGY